MGAKRLNYFSISWNLRLQKIIPYKDRQDFKNKNPDQWVDLDGDGILEFDPDMPPYPSYKFFTETRWESDTDGGYIGIVYIPITRDVDGWSITLKFSMPIVKVRSEWPK